MTIDVRVIRPDELGDWFEAFSTAFYIWRHDPRALADARRETIEIDRCVAAYEGDAMVGTYRTFPTDLTLPGNASIPVNAISAVSVRPTHRRRGILTRMVEDDTRRALDHGEQASILMASEWPIYGRFGFGPATWGASWTIRTRHARFLVPPKGSIEVAEAVAAREIVEDVYGRYASVQPGEITRPSPRWDFELGLTELPGRPRWRGSVALHRDAAGVADGYARYHGEEHWDAGIPDNVLILDELHATSIEAEIDLWRFLAEMDLTAEIRAEARRAREPLTWYLADARAARPGSVAEMLWLRPLDVERCLSARAYDRVDDVVLEVVDPLGPGGPAAGRFRLDASPQGATCRRTTAEADVTIEARLLGAALLGGTRLVDAARAGGAEEHRRGSLARVDRLLVTADEPWCSTGF